MTNKETFYKTHNLFTHVTDKSIQANNRANVMANIFEDNQRDGKVSDIGLGLITGYMGALPEADRKAAYDDMVVVVKERGWLRTH